MSEMLRRMGRWLLVGTLLVSLGGHLVVLQSLAWANMLVGYSRTGSFSEAAKKTFDGKHPCPLCKAVNESRKQEEKKPLVKAGSKMEILLPAPVRLKEPTGSPVEVSLPDDPGGWARICLDVPLRPPRRA